MPRLIDSHTHVQFAAYKDDAEAVIERALREGIWMVNVGTQRDTSAKAVEIAEKYPKGVYATVGIHPIHTEKSYHDEQELGEEEFSAERGSASGGDYDYYKKLGEHEKVVAIGECGFDYYRLGENTKEKQEEAFVAQINLAAELKKPLMIHCRPGEPGRTSPQNGAGRNAYPDLIRILDSRFQLLVSTPGIIHFFSGTKEDAKKLMDIGFYFSFGGVITFVRDYDEVIKYIGLERIVLETDAPYVTPIPHRGKRNEPAYVKFVAEKLAEVLGKSVEEIAERTTKNAREVLRI